MFITKEKNGCNIFNITHNNSTIFNLKINKNKNEIYIIFEKNLSFEKNNDNFIINLFIGDNGIIEDPIYNIKLIFNEKLSNKIFYILQSFIS